MRTTSVPKVRNRKPKEDPHYTAAVERAKSVAQGLRRAGIIDAEGHRIRKDLPPDMQEGQDRDYGG